MKYKFYFIFLLIGHITIGQNKSKIIWKNIDQGLDLAHYKSPKQSILGNDTITILKINPAFYNFNLFSAKESGEYTRTASEWANNKKQIAIINAGMYRMDHLTNLGYMKDYNFNNNSRLNKDNTIVAFNRLDKTIPGFQIIDLKCQNWELLKDKYQSFTQSIRMVDCNQKNKWGKQQTQWSAAAIAKDKQGNALFIISRSPYTMHDFTNIILQAPLNMHNLMYLEGGPEASLYLNHNKLKIEIMGSYETGFNENNDNKLFWKIPNVIGISKK